VIVLVAQAAVIAGVQWPLRLSANGRQLLDENGTPFLLIGDAACAMAVNLSPAEMASYLDDRVAKGFTTLIVRAIDSDVSAGGPTDYRGATPFSHGPNDWSVRNETYWQTVDMLMARAKARDLLVIFVPAYLGNQCGSQGWCESMKSQSDAAMYDYGRFIAKRYKEYKNIVWLDGGDCDANQYGTAIDRVIALKNGIVSIDPGTLRLGHTNRNGESAPDYPWIDTHPAYSDCDSSSLRIRTEFDRQPTLPVMLLEGRYENEGASSSCIASQAMWSLLGGAIGHVFGNRPIWDFSSGWQGPSGIGATGSVQMWNIGKLMRSRAWWRFEPDYAHTTVTFGFGTLGTAGYVPAARTDDGQTIMAFLPSTVGPVRVNMARVGGPSAKAWWYDNKLGTSTLIGSFPATGTRDFTAPAQDLTLVLDVENAALSAPGTTTFAPPLPLARAVGLRLLPPVVAAGNTINLTMRWLIVPGAASYRIYRSGNAAGTWNDSIAAGSTCFDTNGDALDDTCEFTWGSLPRQRTDYFLVTGYAGYSESPLH
jgi:hypothetical protein